MSQEKRYDFSGLKTRYIFLRTIEIVFLSASTVLLTAGISRPLSPFSTTSLIISLISGALVAIILVTRYRLLKLDVTFFASYLNKTYPTLKESADLLMKEDRDLTVLQRIQKEKTSEEYNRLYPEIKLPHHIIQSAGILIVCGASYLLLSSFSTQPEITGNQEIISKTPIETLVNKTDTTSASIKNTIITIVPPLYTGIKPFRSANNNINIPESSNVSFEVNFTGGVSEVKLILSGTDSILLKQKENQSYFINKSIAESGFYQIQWTFRDKKYRSDFYRIEIIKDDAPKVSVTNLEQFTKLRYDENLKVGVKSTMADDYGITDSHIIATVSKGSGESVKFREEKLRFTSPSHFSGKNIEAFVTLDLEKLGLEPGDELYFYVETADNKSPLPNRQRTETFFIAVQDTTAEVIAMGDGLGVDLLPEYFRSQRQIIIDSEQLLKDKKEKKVTTKEFNFKSNELGYDQKVLRLRYGQFMGEEADSGIPHDAIEQQEEEEEPDKEGKDVLQKFGHAHDTENEQNLVEQKKEPSHDHGGQKDTGENEDPMKAFMHNHDDSEEATFLFQSVKAKLKAALAVMWDAELHLRMFDPAKSLPYQYKALNLLKEISNDNRIYVARSGFDPPPLKEEKRLSADLSEIKNKTNNTRAGIQEDASYIRAAIVTTEELLTTRLFVLSTRTKEIYQQAGQELAVKAIEEPVIYLEGLSLLKKLTGDTNDKKAVQEALQKLQPILWRAVPQKPSSPSANTRSLHFLDKKFLYNLQTEK